MFTKNFGQNFPTDYQSLVERMALAKRRATFASFITKNIRNNIPYVKNNKNIDFLYQTTPKQKNLVPSLLTIQADFCDHN